MTMMGNADVRVEFGTDVFRRLLRRYYASLMLVKASVSGTYGTQPRASVQVHPAPCYPRGPGRYDRR